MQLKDRLVASCLQRLQQDALVRVFTVQAKAQASLRGGTSKLHHRIRFNGLIRWLGSELRCRQCLCRGSDTLAQFEGTARDPYVVQPVMWLSLMPKVTSHPAFLSASERQQGPYLILCHCLRLLALANPGRAVEFFLGYSDKRHLHQGLSLTFVVFQFFADLKVAVLFVLFEAWENEANWINLFWFGDSALRYLSCLLLTPLWPYPLLWICSPPVRLTITPH